MTLMEASSSQKITIKLKNPNPLFEKWLTEWRDQAKEKNLKTVHNFDLALKSLKKYPLPFEKGKDCAILKGFGNKLCSMLDKKLKEHKNSQNGPDCTILYDVSEVANNLKKLEKKKRSIQSQKVDKDYVPKYRTGGFGILLALHEINLESSNFAFSTKEEIISKAQKYCEKSYTKAETGSFYTAWSSMSTLLTKCLVEKKSSPPKFSLTEIGKDISEKLWKNNEIREKELKTKECNTLNSIKEPEVLILDDESNTMHCSPNTSSTNDNLSQKSSTSRETIADVETIVFSPLSFDIVLLVDIKETSSDDENIQELKQHDILFEVRDLKVGDFTWICRNRMNNSQELIMPYIVERKRIDDLAKSIKDQRYHEQKFRLTASGIQNKIYMIESYGTNKHIGLPIQNVMQAITNTLIKDKFQIKFTQNVRHSMRYLVTFTKMLKKLYEGKTMFSTTKEHIKEINIHDDLISLMVFKDFNQTATKEHDFTIKDMFVQFLICLKGVSIEKALAIVEKYPTPKLLQLEYQNLGEEGEKLLVNVTYGSTNKKIGAVISRTIFQLFTQEKLL